VISFLNPRTGVSIKPGAWPRKKWFWIEEPVITGDSGCAQAVARHHGLGLFCFLVLGSRLQGGVRQRRSSADGSRLYTYTHFAG